MRREELALGLEIEPRCRRVHVIVGRRRNFVTFKVQFHLEVLTQVGSEPRHPHLFSILLKHQLHFVHDYAKLLMTFHPRAKRVDAT